MASRSWRLGHCTLCGVNWKYGWTLRGWPHFRKQLGGRIIIVERFYSVSQMYWNSIGVFQPPVLIHAFGNNSTIEIGDDVGISGCTITALKEVKIGNRVLIGSGVLITDNDGHAIAPENRYLRMILRRQQSQLKMMFLSARVPLS